jgi:hypothetical protein
VYLLKIHRRCHESDPVLNIAYNLLAGGDGLQDLELLRNNEVYLDADRTIAPTTGECKAGRGLGYDGPWGYPPLVISLANECKNLRLKSEDVAELEYRPTACKTSCRLVVRKNLSVEKGEAVLFDDLRYFYFISNWRAESRDQIVRLAHRRCDQENLIEPLKSGGKAMAMPVAHRIGNRAYRVMARRWEEKHEGQKWSVLEMEFKPLVQAFVRLPCQIVKQGGKIVYRLLSWNPWEPVLFRVVEALRRPMRC